ncbi:hypothetical protein O3M35_005024 [Rhynocoris fuscipes]|uniref:CRAL-TRIO domain-containing protein n=1 Tax=Rhynocoris fuscipes TaxID=488301 RepID=A0AAW1DGQ6_9HEMI
MTEYKTTLERMIAEENPNNDKISEKVLKELNYSKKQLESDLVHLKEWLKDQHHLPACRLKECDNFLCHYLTGCKGSIEKAKRKLDAYYSLRGKSEVYSNRDPMDEEYKKIWDTSVSITVPKYDENTTECVFINKLLTSEIHPNFLLNTLKIAINMQEAAIRLEAIIRPCIAIFDYSNYTPAHAALFSPAVTKDYIYIAQNLFPSRMRKVLFINVPSYLEIIVNTVFKPFITKKLRERFIVTTEGWEIVPQHVNKSILPKDCGGDLRYTLKEINDAYNEYEITNRDWWINELSEQTDESKRNNTDDNYKGGDTYFGVQGTLKKLVID